MGNEVQNEGADKSNNTADAARPSLFEGFKSDQPWQQAADSATEKTLPKIELYDGDKGSSGNDTAAAAQKNDRYISPNRNAPLISYRDLTKDAPPVVPSTRHRSGTGSAAGEQADSRTSTTLPGNIAGELANHKTHSSMPKNIASELAEHKTHTAMPKNLSSELAENRTHTAMSKNLSSELAENKTHSAIPKNIAGELAENNGIGMKPRNIADQLAPNQANLKSGNIENNIAPNRSTLKPGDIADKVSNNSVQKPANFKDMEKSISEEIPSKKSQGKAHSRDSGRPRRYTPKNTAEEFSNNGYSRRS